ncbi:hypothetical protein A5712_05125 [Mycobacterium sp. E2327]|uniref:hypothetical protein n=1 Tax=Mycobacterium sp. E2327 TaxID=1834132 RepID=UPI0007FCC249|nr:hypothetical protein [Mycobacterium sp. E2327]OBI13387.1 hypothetical protein A5712_05125 [Mycobacterium sp. E2327]
MAATDTVSPRSYALLTHTHLRRLLEIANRDLEKFFDRNPHLHIYRTRVLLTGLCQGAALHYLDQNNGVKDLDIYTFFAAHPDVRLQRRRGTQADFGHSELGRHPADVGYVGRRVDMFVKTIECGSAQRPEEAVREYLRSSRTATARYLTAKAVIGLSPPDLFGATIWPVAE